MFYNTSRPSYNKSIVNKSSQLFTIVLGSYVGPVIQVNSLQWFNRSQPSHNKSIVYGAGGHLVTSSAFLKRSPCLLWHTTNNLHICTMLTIYNSEIRTENCFESEATLVISTLKGLLILPWSWCSASSNAPLPDRS